MTAFKNCFFVSCHHRLRFLFLTLALQLCSTVASAADLHVAIASNFKFTLNSVIELIHKNASKDDSEYAGIEIITSSGSSGVLYAQIMKGAPYDVFLSADALRADKLIAQGIALAASRKVYARGQLALWCKKLGCKKLRCKKLRCKKLRNKNESLDIQLSKKFQQRYTLANPKLAPYGLAAKRVMQEIGSWREPDSQRIMAQNIAGAFQYIASGTVKLGWVSLSQLKQWQIKHPLKKNHIWIPPLEDYPAINQVAVVLKNSRHLDKAKWFIDKLSAPDVQSLIKLQGYLVNE